MFVLHGENNSANRTPKTNDLWIYDHKGTLDSEGNNGHSNHINSCLKSYFVCALHQEGILYPLAFTFISMTFALMAHAVRNLLLSLLIWRKIAS